MRVNLKSPEEKVKQTEIVGLSTASGKHDMVIAFDTTGSMAAYLSNVKSFVSRLIPKLFKLNPDLRLGIVAFGDYIDMDDKDIFGKAYQSIGLTNSKKDLISFVSNAKYTDGGDYDEFYELVIKKIVEETDWRKDSTKSVLFIADANPHPIGYSFGKSVYYVRDNSIDWREEAEKAAKLGIKFDTLSIRPENAWYSRLSSMTGGINVLFSNSARAYELVEAAVLARGGENTRILFKKTLSDAMKSGDAELTKIYNAYSADVF